MSSQKSAMRVLCLVAIVSAAACSGQSPVAPGSASPSSLSTDADGTVGQASSARAPATQGAIAGNYEIGFLKETRTQLGLQPVVDNTLNVGEFLVLTAQVTDADGVRVQQGRITYEYCSLDNVKVPSSECVSGQGRWKRIWTMDVDPYGSRFGFGSCSTPRTIGFRLRYDGGANADVADGVSAPKDVTWQ